MPLQFLGGERFATGACPYACRPATAYEETVRVFIPIRIDDVPVDAVIDTGAMHLICGTETIDNLGLHPADSLGRRRILIRGQIVAGDLHRVSLTVPAHQGEVLTQEVTAFVPILDPGEESNLPTFLGWQYCLERIRFAVDPATETFYFGTL